MNTKYIDCALKQLSETNKKAQLLLKRMNETKKLFVMLKTAPQDRLSESIQECKIQLEEIKKILEESRKDFSSIIMELYGKFFLEMQIQLEDIEKNIKTP